MEILKRKVLPVAAAGLLAMTLVAAALADKFSWTWLLILTAGALGWRTARKSLFAYGLLASFGLALACLPVLGLSYLAHQERGGSWPCYDLSQLERLSGPVALSGKFQLSGSVYFSARDRVYTKNYGWVQPIYSRKHPRFPGNHGPDQPAAFYLMLDRDHLDRLAHRFLPPLAQEGIRDHVFVRQTRTGFLQEQPGDLLVLPCVARAGALAFAGAALFGSGLALLVSSLGQQHRARYQISQWDRRFGPE